MHTVLDPILEKFPSLAYYHLAKVFNYKWQVEKLLSAEQIKQEAMPIVQFAIDISYEKGGMIHHTNLMVYAKIVAEGWGRSSINKKFSQDGHILESDEDPAISCLVDTGFGSVKLFICEDDFVNFETPDKNFEDYESFAQVLVQNIYKTYGSRIYHGSVGVYTHGL